MSAAALKQMSDEELRREQAVWHAATIGSRLRQWIDQADRNRNQVVAEGLRRRADFWRVTLS